MQQVWALQLSIFIVLGGGRKSLDNRGTRRHEARSAPKDTPLVPYVVIFGRGLDSMCSQEQKIERASAEIGQGATLSRSTRCHSVALDEPCWPLPEGPTSMSRHIGGQLERRLGVLTLMAVHETTADADRQRLGRSHRTLGKHRWNDVVQNTVLAGGHEQPWQDFSHDRAVWKTMDEIPPERFMLGQSP